MGKESMEPMRTDEIYTYPRFQNLRVLFAYISFRTACLKYILSHFVYLRREFSHYIICR